LERVRRSALGCVGAVGVPQSPPHFPLGALAANLVGGYLVGFAIAFFGARRTARSRLFVTGFSAASRRFDVFVRSALLLRGEYWTGGSLALAHLAGSLVLTVAGIATFRALVS
jgi:CrcB protein